MHIRPETPADYAALNTLHILAFDNKASVATLVALLRTRAEYDPELSLVAEVDGVVVGQAIFSPLTAMIRGQAIRGVNLSPLAVHPDYQKQGIGDALMRRGHNIARGKDYEFSVLLGHPTYYPRFGYQTKAYGVSSIEISVKDLPPIDLETSAPVPDDVPILAELLLKNEKNVNLTLVPENTLAEWLSSNLAVACTVYRHEGDTVGYTRATDDNVKLFLARDEKMARAIAKHLAKDKETITLPLHPQSSMADAFEEKAEVTAWDAGMLYSLSDDSSVNDYLADLEQDGSVGRIIWFSVFDIA